MPSPEAEPSNAPAAIDWGTVMADPAPAAEPLLQVGVYITNISDIDLREDQFSIELLLWSLWHGDPDQNPSDQLRVLNGIYNGDIPVSYTHLRAHETLRLSRMPSSA